MFESLSIIVISCDNQLKASETSYITLRLSVNLVIIERDIYFKNADQNTCAILTDVKEYYRCCMRTMGCIIKLLKHFQKDNDFHL